MPTEIINQPIPNNELATETLDAAKRVLGEAHAEQVSSSPEMDIQPRTILDEQGYQRRIYQVTPDLSVSFRGREELPTISAAALDQEDVASALLEPEELPHIIEPHEFQTYVDEHPDTKAPKEHLIVNATPLGVVDLAIRLQGTEVPNPQLASLQANLRSGNIGEKENALLDLMSAAVFARDRSNQGVERTDGLMDVVMALHGDQKKQAELTEKMRTLESQEKYLKVKELGEDVLGLVFEHEPINAETIKHAEGLVLVRTTNNEPGVDENGVVFMQPAAEYTKDMRGSKNGQAFIPRQTTHFTLNHFVQSHLLGNFENRNFTVIAPLDAALQANGRPAALFGVDTYFTAGPGERVLLPGARILEPAEDQTELVVDEGNVRRVKSQGFTHEDIDRVVKACDEGGAFRALSPYGSRSIQKQIMNVARDHNLVSTDGTIRLWDGNHYHDEKVVASKDVESMDTAQMLDTILSSNPAAMDSFMQSLVETLAVDATIAEQGGYTVQPSGTSNYVDTPGFDKRVSELADELHVNFGLHKDMIESDVELASMLHLFSWERYNKDREHTEDQRYEWENPNLARGEALNRLLSSPDCPQRLRRAALEAGLLTVRGGEAAVQDQKEKAEDLTKGVGLPLI